MVDHLFVYFRIVERDVAATLPCWQHWLDTAEEAAGVASALMRWPETRDGRATWVESYDDVPPAFATMLVALWETGGPCEFVAGERHTELFVDLENS